MLYSLVWTQDASADLLSRSHGANALLSRLDSDASADLLSRSHGANALFSRLDPASVINLISDSRSLLGPGSGVTHLQSTSAHLLKRTERSSPCPTPSRQTQTPVAKRNRTGTERGMSSQPNPAKSFARCTLNSNTEIVHSKLLSDFEPTPAELTSMLDLQDELHSYIFLRSSAHNSKDPESTFLGMQQFFSVVRANNTEKSNVQYLEVMDAVADTKDTMIALLHNLHSKYILHQHQEFLVLEGDAKLFDIVQSLKHEYGDELRWVNPYPGDWHVLKNYQIALLKPYFDAGLKEMAGAAGYPVSQIQSCSQFKRVHYFLLDDATSTNIQAKAMKLLEETIHQHANFVQSFNEKLSKITELLGSKSSTKFVQFLEHMSSRDGTWCLWSQFILQDGLAYVGFYLAIRSGDWDLRMACLKKMAAVFTAFDHLTYQRLISQHLADVLCMPPAILTAFRHGAFVVSISGNSWHVGV